MNHHQTVKISKFLSRILRHNPSLIGLTLDEQGWADVDELLEKANQTRKFPISRAQLDEVVANNNKQRFKFSEDGTRIRANQGHSINIDLGLKPSIPPAVLYHGTAARFVDSIMKNGINSGRRQHVHLSLDVETATTVGKRHGKPVILTIDCAQMSADGLLFYLSDNNVWLIDHVPVEYLTVSKQG